VRPTQDYKVRGDEVKEFFSRFGEVRDVYLPVDYYTRKARGFGFVEFLKYEDAKTALERTDNVEVLGNVVKVVFAREGRKAVNIKAAG
jgi:RNA recognition motif-containing protein